ncbi:MAG: hypothetical protein ACPHL6_07120, partial [Rubripirellula sp.]
RQQVSVRLSPLDPRSFGLSLKTPTASAFHRRAIESSNSELDPISSGVPSNPIARVTPTA